MSQAARTSEPWHEPWPADGLESVPTCPVCGAAGRSLLFADLVDKVFRVAPGRWQLWRCHGCGSAYLDPRPSIDTIHLAYSNYYTHAEPAAKDDFDRLSSLRKLRRRLVNGYTRWRFSNGEEPYSYWGLPLLFALPSQRRRLDSEYRHLPKRLTEEGALLDIGCGNGDFLHIAARCGWHVMGIDPDAGAADACRRRGLHVVHGSIGALDSAQDQFDVITLSHVIEHVHDPLGLLRACHRLLKPNGQIWIQTPSITSEASRRYGCSWRGLEPPRHLVLFNYRSLRDALRHVGFHRMRCCAVPNPIKWIANASNNIQGDVADSAYKASIVGQRLFLAKACLYQALSPSSREFLTLAAYKTGTLSGTVST